MQHHSRPSMPVDRIKALTDGVLAIVLTILVLGFEVPDHDFAEDGMGPFFVNLREPFLAYAVTFGIVATYWLQHTALFHYVRVADRSFIWLNLLMLMPIGLLPFLTGLRARYHTEYLVTIFYASANVIIGAIMLLIWRYAVRRGLIRALAPGVDRSMRRRILLGMAVNVLGALVAPISVHLSGVVLLTLPLLYLSHKAVDLHWTDDQTAA